MILLSYTHSSEWFNSLSIHFDFGSKLCNMFSYRSNKLALEAYCFHLFQSINIKKLNLDAFFWPTWYFFITRVSTKYGKKDALWFTLTKDFGVERVKRRCNKKTNNF